MNGKVHEIINLLRVEINSIACGDSLKTNSIGTTVACLLGPLLDGLLAILMSEAISQTIFRNCQSVNCRIMYVYINFNIGFIHTSNYYNPKMKIKQNKEKLMENVNFLR